MKGVDKGTWISPVTLCFTAVHAEDQQQHTGPSHPHATAVCTEGQLEAPGSRPLPRQGESTANQLHGQSQPQPITTSNFNRPGAVQFCRLGGWLATTANPFDWLIEASVEE